MDGWSVYDEKDSCLYFSSALIHLMLDFLLRIRMLKDMSEFFLCLKRRYKVYMERNKNKSKSLIFSGHKTVFKLKESTV